METLRQGANLSNERAKWCLRLAITLSLGSIAVDAWVIFFFSDNGNRGCLTDLRFPPGSLQCFVSKRKQTLSPRNPLFKLHLSQIATTTLESDDCSEFAALASIAVLIICHLAAREGILIRNCQNQPKWSPCCVYTSW